jgi:GAF domain-containing protein/HAMP domain-containing protein
MRNRLSFARYWRKLSITSKFTLALSLFLLLILLMALTGLLALSAVRRQAETAILTGVETQQPASEPAETVQPAPPAEVGQTQVQIIRISQAASAVLVFAVLIAILLAVPVVLLLKNSITRNVVDLNDAALRLQQGELDARADVASDDELGQLADTLNQLAEQVKSQVDDEMRLRRQNEYLEALHDTAIGLISHLNLSELLEDILTSAGQLIGTKHSYVYLVDSSAFEIERKIGVGIYAEATGMRLKPGEGVAGRVWQSGSPLVVNDISSWSGRSPQVDYDRIRSLAGVPLISRSKVVGVLGMAHGIKSGKQFHDGEIKLLSRFAQLASLVLDNAQLYTTAQEEKKRSNDLLNVVIPIGVALSAEQNFDRLLEKILLEAKSFCNSDGGTLYLRTDSEDLKFVIVRNDSLDIAMGGTSGRPIDFPAVSLYDEATGEPNHSNVAAHVALTGTSINIHDAYEAEGFNFSGTKTFDQSTGYRSTSFLTLPLKNAYDQVVGVLQLINALEPHTSRVIPFDPSLEQIVGSLSSLATVALEAYKRERSLRQQIQQLRIEIDEVKRKKQVTEIIETDFFQDLQDKAREIRRRSKSNRFEKPE